MPAEAATSGPSPKNIFLSYARPDRDRASAVKLLLELGGAHVFMDWRSIAPGVEWEAALGRALADCDVLCVFWSTAAQESEWVREEYTTFTRAYPERLCVPLRADAAPLPPELAARQAPPEFLALANELLALRQDLVERGISRRETRRIVRAHLARHGLRLDDAQLAKLLGLFAGASLGVLVTSVAKSGKLAALLAGIAVAVSLVWRPWVADHGASPEPARDVAGVHDDSNSRVVAEGIAARTERAPAARAEDAARVDPVVCDATHFDDARCPRPPQPRPQIVVNRAPGASLLPWPAEVSSDRWDSSGWIKLGEREVSRTGHDVIGIGDRDDSFAKLMLYVEHGDLELVDFEIAFGNRQAFHPPAFHVFKDGSRTWEIGLLRLLGAQLAIASIDLESRMLPGSDRVRIELWGWKASGPGTAVAPAVPPAALSVAIAAQLRNLTDASYRVRLAAVLALSRSSDPRVLTALADVVVHDEDATLRRAAVLVLGKRIYATTPREARDRVLDALAWAAANDRVPSVRATVERIRQSLAGGATGQQPPGDTPDVFVEIVSTTDLSKVAPSDAGDRLAGILLASLERAGYSTSWPGGRPTLTELASSHARAFIVAPTIQKIEVSMVSRQTQISCKVEIRVALWSGVEAASASGSAKAMAGNSDREIAGGMRDCLEAVAEDVTARHILPFLKRLASDHGSASDPSASKLSRAGADPGARAETK